MEERGEKPFFGQACPYETRRWPGIFARPRAMLGRLLGGMPLRKKAVFFLIALLLPLCVTLTTSLAFLWHRTSAALDRRLTEAEGLARRGVDLFRENTRTFAGIVAGDHLVRQGVYFNDMGVIRHHVDHLIGELNVNHIQLYDNSGWMLHQASQIAPKESPARSSAVKEALAGREAFVVERGHKFALMETCRPVRHANIDDMVVGCVCVGYRLDDDLFEQIKKAAGIDVLLIDGDEIIADSFAFGKAFATRNSAGLERTDASFEIDGVAYDAMDIGFMTEQFGSMRMYAALDHSEIRTALTRTIFSIAVVFLMVGSVGIAVALGIASNVVRSVSVIVRHARNLSNGRFDDIVDIQSDDECGEVAETFNLMTQNLKKNIQRVETQARELSATKTYLKNVVDSMPSLLIGADSEGAPAMFNRQARTFFADSGICLEKTGLAEILSPYEPQAKNQVEKAVRGRRDLALENLRVENGASFLFHNLTVFPVLGLADGGSMIRIDDVTDRYLLECQLRQAQKMEAIGTLAGGIAHDFNNILTAIIGYTDLASLKAENNEPVAEDLEKIAASAMRAKDLTHQILTFGSKAKHDLEAIVLKDKVKDALNLIRSAIPKWVAIEEQLESEARVLADSTQIYQILMNLCVNASHAMNDGKGSIRVSVRDMASANESGKKKNRVALSVADDGAGIAKENLEKIFDPFFTTKPPGQGTGLGLSVIHGIVRNYKGEIRVQSEPGKGAVFEIILPALQSEAVASEGPTIQMPTGSEHVLLVDDEKMIVESESELLKTLGYRVTGMTCGKKAIDAVRKAPGDFDLVITDLSMPALTGDQLAEQLRTIRPDLPVVIATGYDNWLPQSRIENLGIRKIVGKPFVLKELALTIRDAIGG